MLQSLKTRNRGHERTKYKSTSKINSNYKKIPIPILPTHISPSAVIYNSNTMDIEFLVQMRQCNKCESVQNDEIFNLHLGSDAGP